MRRIFITGTAGFIGFHLARRLLDQGHRSQPSRLRNTRVCSQSNHLPGYRSRALSNRAFGNGGLPGVHMAGRIPLVS